MELEKGTAERLKAIVGPKGWSDDAAVLAPRLEEWRGRYHGSSPLLLRPASLAETAAVVGLCAERGVALTPQGGNTGLVGGQIPQGEVLLSLERMRAVRALDLADDVIVVEAGATLASVQAAAEAAGRFFPLSLASEGSCTIGGLVSTNAGGVGVLRYGMMRALVLGLEAVLPDGSAHEGLSRLRKDNTGYDLKQLLIGAEGTLGVVTAASLRLFPLLHDRTTAVAAVSGPADAVALLVQARTLSGGAVEAFELISRSGVELAVKTLPGVRDPLSAPAPYLVLLEIAHAAGEASRTEMERLLEGALGAGLVRDAAIAGGAREAMAFWALREGQSAAQKGEGPVWKHDVATPVSRIAAFIAEAEAAVLALSPGARVVAFGHVGDGNIHFDVLKPLGSSDARHEALREEAAQRVHDLAAAHGGSISAEHGLGVMKTEAALRYKSRADVAAMRAIRAALDPGRIMNPRVLF
jgi:FAD/FMN-containing dehydrogenase